MSFLFKALNTPTSQTASATETMAEAVIRTPEEAGKCCPLLLSAAVPPVISNHRVSPAPAMTACACWRWPACGIAEDGTEAGQLRRVHAGLFPGVLGRWILGTRIALG